MLPAPTADATRFTAPWEVVRVIGEIVEPRYAMIAAWT